MIIKGAMIRAFCFCAMKLKNICNMRLALSHQLLQSHPREGGDPVENSVHGEPVEPFISSEPFDKLRVSVCNWITNCVVQFVLWGIGTADACSGSCLRDPAFAGMTQ